MCDPVYHVEYYCRIIYSNYNENHDQFYGNIEMEKKEENENEKKNFSRKKIHFSIRFDFIVIDKTIVHGNGHDDDENQYLCCFKNKF